MRKHKWRIWYSCSFLLEHKKRYDIWNRRHIKDDLLWNARVRCYKNPSSIYRPDFLIYLFSLKARVSLVSFLRATSTTTCRPSLLIHPEKSILSCISPRTIFILFAWLPFNGRVLLNHRNTMDAPRNRIFLVFDFSKKGTPFYLYSYHRIPYESLFYLAGHSDIPVLNLVAQNRFGAFYASSSRFSLLIYLIRNHGECARLMVLSSRKFRILTFFKFKTWLPEPECMQSNIWLLQPECK